MPVKLIDGFIYSMNINFCIIPDMAFVKWSIFNSKPGLSKGNLVLTIYIKKRMCSSIDNKVWKSVYIFVFTWTQYAFHSITPFTFWDMRMWDIWTVYLQTFRNNRICYRLACFFRNLYTSRINDWIIWNWSEILC